MDAAGFSCLLNKHFTVKRLGDDKCYLKRLCRACTTRVLTPRCLTGCLVSQTTKAQHLFVLNVLFQHGNDALGGM